MTALYLLAAEFRDSAMQLADLDLDAQTIADTLEGMSGDIAIKMVNVAMVVRNREASADAIDAAIKTMQARSKAYRAGADYMRHYLLTHMQQTGMTKIEDSPYLRLAVRDNPPAVDIFDAAQIPAEFMAPAPPAPPPAPDKVAIKAAIKAGRDVAGCRIMQGQRLEIK